MDFRGRTYPIPAHLNHIGPDIGRGTFCMTFLSEIGLLMFADGKPLGNRGFYWLQIHLANLAGNLFRHPFYVVIRNE